MSRDISKGVQSKFSALMAIRDVGIGEKWTPRQKVILNSNNNNNNNNNNKKEQTIISKHPFRTWSWSVPQIWYLHLKYTVLGTAKQRDGLKKDKRLHWGGLEGHPCLEPRDPPTRAAAAPQGPALAPWVLFVHGMDWKAAPAIEIWCWQAAPFHTH